MVQGILEARGEGDLRWVFREGLPVQILFCGRSVGVKEQLFASLGSSKGGCQGYPGSAWSQGKQWAMSERRGHSEGQAYATTLSRELS